MIDLVLNMAYGHASAPNRPSSLSRSTMARARYGMGYETGSQEPRDRHTRAHPRAAGGGLRWRGFLRVNHPSFPGPVFPGISRVTKTGWQRPSVNPLRQ